MDYLDEINRIETKIDRIKQREIIGTLIMSGCYTIGILFMIGVLKV